MEDYSDREDISYHELFSKDSGLMEFMEWKKTDCNVCVNVVFWGKNYGNYDYNYRYWNIEYHYMIMWPMNKQGKIDYFNTNAYLPWNAQDVEND